MRIIKKKPVKQGIDIGDIVEYDGEVCIIGFEENITREELPVIIVSLETGQLLQGYRDLEELNESVDLLCSSERATLHLDLIGEK